MPRDVVTQGNKLAFMISSVAAFTVLSGAAHATTITVDRTGAPVSGHCNLTDAVQAATTNAIVHGCAAGSSRNTDTIILAANTTYQGYGKALHIPPGGGALVIQGTLSNNAVSSIIMSANYGYPNPAGGTSACSDPAAIFVGGTLTVKNLILQASETGTAGICQYDGSLTVSGADIGDSLQNNGFNARGIFSYPDGANNHRSITLQNAQIYGNYSPNIGAGIGLFGDVDFTMTNSGVQHNNADESGGGIAWVGGWGKMGNVSISVSDILYNQTGVDSENAWGGGLYLAGDDVNASVVLSGTQLQQNDADTQTGGAIYIGPGMGTNKVVLADCFFLGNNAYIDLQQSTLNSDSWVYDAVYCQQGTAMGNMSGSEWSGHSPPLKGDGTCTF
jgi:hypothetical protein